MYAAVCSPPPVGAGAPAPSATSHARPAARCPAVEKERARRAGLQGLAENKRGSLFFAARAWVKLGKMWRATPRHAAGSSVVPLMHFAPNLGSWFVGSWTDPEMYGSVCIPLPASVPTGPSPAMAGRRGETQRARAARLTCVPGGRFELLSLFPQQPIKTQLDEAPLTVGEGPTYRCPGAPLPVPARPPLPALCFPPRCGAAARTARLVCC
jgi:hypothetical protein